MAKSKELVPTEPVPPSLEVIRAKRIELVARYSGGLITSLYLDREENIFYVYVEDERLGTGDEFPLGPDENPMEVWRHAHGDIRNPLPIYVRRGEGGE